MQSLDEIVEAFGYFSDWEDKYRYLIELGENLPVLANKYKTDAYKVDGCMSQVWLVADRQQDGRYAFQADSDALIVKGLIALILAAYHNKTRDEIRQVNIEEIFHRLGLDEHLSPTRRNGFFSMVARIQSLE